MTKLRVELKDQIGTSRSPAEVLIYDENNKLVVKVTGTVDLKEGLDGGYYSCVILKEVQL